MKRLVLMFFIALMGVSFVAVEAQAKRLGGGASSGMKRTTPPPQQAPQAPPAQQAQPGAAGAATGAAAAAGRPSWLAPVAGLAAGLGIAALASHFGFGGELANFMTMLLVAIVAFVAIRWLMNRMRPAQAAPRGMAYAGAGAGAGASRVEAPVFGSGGGSGAALPVAAGAAPSSLPAGFDAAGFERIAKLIFIRMQAANDAGDLDDLRRFSTPEMFATFRLDLQDRPAAPQKTDVVQLDAQVLDFAHELGQQIVSVRFHGLIREEAGAAAAPFDEVWHLVKPEDGSREWAIAGIAQSEAA